MKKYIPIILVSIIGIGAITTAVVVRDTSFGAPSYIWQRSILPEVDDTYYLGTTTQKWLGVNTEYIISEVASTTRLQVGSSPPVFSGLPYFNEGGDMWATGRTHSRKGLSSDAISYGAGLSINDSGSNTISTNIAGDATLTAATKIITDANATFGTPTSTYKGAFFTVIDSTPSFKGATGEIIEVLSNETIVLSFGTAGTDTIVDATGMSYIIYEHPVFFVGDNGFVSASVGLNEDAKFEIHIPDGRGFHGFYIDDVAGADQHQAMTIDTDIAGYDGIVSLSISGGTSSTTASDSLGATMINLEGDGTNFTNSQLRFINAGMVGGNGATNDVDFIHLEGFPAAVHIIHSGTEDTIQTAYYDDGASTSDVTTEFKSTGSNITIFENDDSIIYIGSDTEFTNVGISLSTNGSKNIDAEYYYCNGDNSWLTLPGVVDTTAGFTNPGTINFLNPGDRGKCDEEMDSTAFGDTTDLYYIAVKRTRNVIPGQDPIENIFSISGGGDFMYMDQYGLKRLGSSGAPYACTASVAGMDYYDSAATALLWCDGSNWIEYAETSDITIHNNLGGLEGGGVAEYYHLDATDYTELTAWIDDVTLVDGGGMTVASATTTDSMYVGGLLDVDGTFDVVNHVHFDDATYNTYLGKDAGEDREATSQFNTIVGFNTFQATLNNADHNTAIGYYTLWGNTTGDYNVGIGSHSLMYNTAGSKNVGLGYKSLYLNTEGIQNMAIGSNSMYYATTSSYNIAIGIEALNRSTIGDYNIGIGGFSLVNNSRGNNNIAIGARALMGVYDAGFGGNIGNNTAIGYEAGNDVTTGGNNNFLLGYRAADKLTTGSGNIVIGYDIDTPAVDTDDYLSIGNIIYGDLSAGKIGIGTSTPSMTFSVEGDALADSWNVYSDMYQGNALIELAKIKPKTGETNDWVSVDHKTLPDGIYNENLVSFDRDLWTASSTEERIDDETIITTVSYIRNSDGHEITEKEYEKLPKEEKSEHVEYIQETMSISNLAQMNTRGILQLNDKIKESPFGYNISDDRFEDLEKRITDLEAKVEELEKNQSVIMKFINWIKNLL